MNKIEYGTEFLDQLKDKVHDYYDENKELKKEIERLKKELEKYKKRCFKGLKLIRDNYGLLDKYGVDMLDDILIGVDKE